MDKVIVEYDIHSFKHNLLVADTVLTSLLKRCQPSAGQMAEEVAPAGHGPAIRPAAGVTATA